MNLPSPLLLLALSACLDPHRIEAHDLGETHLVEPSGPASRRLPLDPLYETLADDLTEAWAAHPGRRAYVQTDKPLYKPGESIWFRAFDVGTASLEGEGSYPVTAELVNPRGAVVLSKRLRNLTGDAHNDITIPATASGGRYLLRMSQVGQPTFERPIIVASYETPRIQKDLDFVREAYGPGDEVQASLELLRATGEPLQGSYTAVVDLDGTELTRVPVTTDGLGKATVRFTLPDAIERGDAQLTVLVDDAGVTESISRRVPILLHKVDLGLFPEGGELVAGLPGRVYLRATTPLGEPADIAGRVLDQDGREVSRFRTLLDGLGRFELTPTKAGRYRVVIDEPAGIASTFELPEAREEGCSLRIYDDPASLEPAVRAGVRCTDAEEVTVQAVVRDQHIDAATVAVAPFEESVVYLAEEGGTAQPGVVRVTLFDGVAPLAERLVFRHADEQLLVEVTPRREEVSPRDEVVLDVRTTTPDGRPVAADLALAVVDETVLSYADDEEPHLLAALLLQAEIPEPIHEPNQFFDPDQPDRHAALDLLLGTAGWRRFDWEAALVPPANLAQLQQERQWAEATEHAIDRGGRGLLEGLGYLVDGVADQLRPARAMPPIPMQMAPQAPMAEAATVAPMGAAEVAAPAPEPEEDDGGFGGEVRPLEGALLDKDAVAANRFEPPADGPVPAKAKQVQAEARRQRADRDLWAGEQVQAAAVAWAPVRTFPTPVYQRGYEGPRTDFRDTVFWDPSVRTDDRGHATVRFHASDAVTNFRVTTEGVGGGRLGRDETTIASKLPFSLGVKLPVAVSEGDRMELPLLLSSELDQPVTVAVKASFGEGLAGALDVDHVDLEAGQRDSRWVDLDVIGKAGTALVSFEAYGAGQSDAFERQLTIEPRGFPGRWEASEELQGSRSWTVDLGEAIDGTVSATVQLYPSPVATLVEGMEGLLREPGGCFEQTSSSNYPNIMVLQYLREHDQVDPTVAQRASSMLDRGYQLLTSYETGEDGYEWFGSEPAHEALSAYGLVEFVDMAQVHGAVDPEMIERTRAYLMSRRDGKGGYQRSSQALDSFGRASAEVTDAYITWSLALAGSVDGLDAELQRSRALARSTDDPYLLALATGTLVEAGEAKAAQAAARRLTGLQADDGSWPGADHSITRSGGNSLTIETTALALLALLELDPQSTEVRDGVAWLQSNRSGYGNFGSTQATILALKAMTTYAQASRATQSAGYLVVEINGEVVDEYAYEAGHQGAITFEGLGDFFSPGVNTITVSHDGETALPLSMAVDYRTDLPATSDAAVVGVQTELDQGVVPMGETVRLTATIDNLTDEGQPMALARIGLPGGLAPQTWQLEELRERGLVDFYETRPREVALYFRDLAPGEVHEVPLELVAEVPGTYTAPASQAYLYYTDEHRHWVAGTEVTITQ